jgi:hypothetical protein
MAPIPLHAHLLAISPTLWWENWPQTGKDVKTDFWAPQKWMKGPLQFSHPPPRGVRHPPSLYMYFFLRPLSNNHPAVYHRLFHHPLRPGWALLTRPPFTAPTSGCIFFVKHGSVPRNSLQPGIQMEKDPPPPTEGGAGKGTGFFDDQRGSGEEQLVKK